MTISIASAITQDRLPFLYILMGSIKDHKKPTTQIDYHVFIPYTQGRDQAYYEEYFSDLADDTFKVHIMDVMPVLKEMGNLEGPHIMYTRCLFPVIFQGLDRILYLDSDVLCLHDGIEEYWETDLADCYAAVSPDPAIIWTDRYKFERDNTGLSRYFNSGIMLFNLAEIRQDGMDQDLVDWLQVWYYDILKPHHHDQTLMNWLFSDKLKWMPSTYNNQVLTSWGYKVDAFEEQAAEDGYPTPLDTLPDTLFLHFCDHNKPWSRNLMYPEVTYPYLKEARDIWNGAVEKYAKKGVRMQDIISIATTATLDRKENVYILLNSLRCNKLPDTQINFYLFVPMTEIHEFQRYLTGIPTDTFHVQIMDVDWFKDKINTSGTIRNHLYYARCLFPQVFLSLDKLLYMDIDMVCCGPGIEELWNENIDGYWVGACIDPTWQYCPAFQHDPQNIGTDHYFNNGMMLMNLKQMREDGKDKEFAEWCLHWDQSKLRCHCFDQTLCNYLLKDKVRLLNTRYNNSLLASLGVARDAYNQYMQEQGYGEPLNSLRDAVLLHFCGCKKPWDPEALVRSADEYPYKDEAVFVWKQIAERYGKHDG